MPLHVSLLEHATQNLLGRQPRRAAPTTCSRRCGLAPTPAASAAPGVSSELASAFPCPVGPKSALLTWRAQRPASLRVMSLAPPVAPSVCPGDDTQRSETSHRNTGCHVQTSIIDRTVVGHLWSDRPLGGLCWRLGQRSTAHVVRSRQDDARPLLPPSPNRSQTAAPPPAPPPPSPSSPPPPRQARHPTRSLRPLSPRNDQTRRRPRTPPPPQPAQCQLRRWWRRLLSCPAMGGGRAHRCAAGSAAARRGAARRSHSHQCGRPAHDSI